MNLPLPFIIILGLIIVSGSCLNGITLYILAFDKDIRKQLSSVRAFMLGETLSNLLVCSIGLPLIFANALFPNFFEQARFFCYLEALFCFEMSAVAIWYQTIIALTRVAAVFAPHRYRRFVKQRCGRALLLCVPLVCGYTGFVVGAAARAYDLTATEGLCMPVPHDTSESSFTLYIIYLMENTVHTLLPLFMGLFCYGAIYARKLYEKLAKKPTNLVGSTSTTIEIAMTASKTAPPTTAFVGNADYDDLNLSAPTVPSNKTTTAITTNVVDARDRKIRLLATVYVVNFICIVPGYIVFGIGYFDTLNHDWPIVAGLLYMAVFFAFVVNPVVYYVVSADFRQAFVRLQAKGS